MRQSGSAISCRSGVPEIDGRFQQARPRQSADRAATLQRPGKGKGAAAPQGRPPRRRRRSWLGPWCDFHSHLRFSGCVGLSALFGYIWFTLDKQGLLRIPERDPGIMILASDGSVLAEQGSFYGDDVRLADLPTMCPTP